MSSEFVYIYILITSAPYCALRFNFQIIIIIRVILDPKLNYVNYNNLNQLTISVNRETELSNLKPDKELLELFTVKIEEFIHLNSTTYHRPKKSNKFSKLKPWCPWSISYISPVQSEWNILLGKCL